MVRYVSAEPSGRAQLEAGAIFTNLLFFYGVGGIVLAQCASTVVSYSRGSLSDNLVISMIAIFVDRIVHRLGTG
jgi:hypothetical protein